MAKPTGLFRLRIDMGHMDFACARLLTWRDECSRLHGHNFQVALELEGQVNDDCFVADLRDVEAVLRETCEALDNYLIVPAQNPKLQIDHVGTDVRIRFKDRQYVVPQNDILLLDLPNSSIEMLAIYLCDEIYRKLAAKGYTNLASLAVEIQETPGQSGLYRKIIEPSRIQSV